VDPDGFIQNLKIAGGTSPERLRSMSYEEILNCMEVVGPIKPIALAKGVAGIFRGKEEPERSGYVSARRVERMTTDELVAAFDPEEPGSPVGKRLAELARGRPFVVFSAGRTLDVPTTQRLLRELKQGFNPIDTVVMGQDVRRVYVLGQLPPNLANENPLYPDRALRPGDVCDQTSRSWEGVPHEVRQLVRLAVVNTGEIKVTIDKAHDVLDMALQRDAASQFRTRYLKAAVLYDDLAKTGSLPSLKVPLGTPGSGNPFTGGARVDLRGVSELGRK